MRDWNHDGKIDARDHYLHDVATGNDEPKESSGPRYSRPGYNWSADFEDGCAGCLSLIVGLPLILGMMYVFNKLGW